jgi:predicted methyltransferase
MRLVVVVASLAAACSSPDPMQGASDGAPLSRAQITAIVANTDRSDADRRNDARRKPLDMLEFAGVRPGMTVLDVSSGGGYTTELLARAVGPRGRVFAQTPRPPSPGLAERLKTPAAANVVSVVRPFESAPPPELPAGFDLVTLMFNYHDMGHLGVDRTRMNAAIFAALKPGASFVIADHSGRPGTGISESGTLHRVEEALVRREVEAAGFHLAAEGMFLRNPNDPRDRGEADTLQPKDEFVLRFVKP